MAALRQARERRASGRTLVESLPLLKEAVDAGVRVFSIAVTAKALEDEGTSTEIRRIAHATGAEVLLVTEKAMARICQVQTPQGVAAEVAIPVRHFEDAGLQGELMVVVGEGIQDPANVGAILRVAEASGATGVVYAGEGADPWGPKALRASAGSAFRVPVKIVPDVVRGVEMLREDKAFGGAGGRIIATGAGTGRSVFEVSLRGPLAFMVGNEGSGLSRKAFELADDVVRVPMFGRCESLNVAAALAVVLFEAARQRRLLSGPAGYPL